MHNPAIVALVVIRMKKTDLVKNLGLKIKGKMQAAGVPGRFAEGAAQLPDRREQRKLDQAAGLVPFAVKLHHDLVKQLHDLAQAQGEPLHTLTERLVRAGLAAAPDAAKAPVAKAPAKKAPAKKAAAPKAEAPPAAAKKAAAKQAVAKKAPAKKVAAKKAAR